MSEEVYTVEQFAERLKLHRKTVLRFIREGRLRAVKVGKSYRILRSEMEAMTGVLPAMAPAAAARVTSIVDLPGTGAEQAQRMARQLPALRLSQEPHPDPMSLDVAYDPARQHLKIVIVGSIEDTSVVLKMIHVMAGD